ncbi:protein phosphatase 2C domain-containing protein [Dactylosporangium sp. NPDC048998]|uniref:protein phosphatase 2C domain-containing protein n=1 Tax=Dactylosporangium sp. NPDC048998 TaxID=3363976 RepID=UPI003718DB47
MGLRWGHLCWFFLLFVVAIAEVLLLAHSTVPAALATVGVVASVAALHLEHRRGSGGRPGPGGNGPAGTAQRAEPPAAFDAPARLGSPAPGPAVVFPASVPGPARPASSSVVRANGAAQFPAPPLFGDRTSAAHTRPWRLPVRLAHPGICADEAALGRLTVRAASVVGPGHRCEEPANARQDAYALGRDAAGRCLVVAVADGLSSGRDSDVGATLAATTAVQLAVQALDRGGEPDFERIFADVAGHLAMAAERRRQAASELSTVLIVAVIDAEPDARGQHAMRYAWIGDVAILAPVDGRWVTLAGDVKAARDGLESNVVNAALPQEPGSVRVGDAELPAGTFVGLVTDGVSDVIRMEPSAADYFLHKWRRPTSAADFLTDISYQARGHQDDRTAVGVWVDGRSGQG